MFALSLDKDSNTKELLETLSERKIGISNPYHAKILFEKDKDKAQLIENKGDGKDLGHVLEFKSETFCLFISFVK